MIFKRLRRGIVVGVLALCASLSATSVYSQTAFTFSRLSVAETLESDKDNRYSIFLEAAKIAGLYDTLADDSQTLTIFPPINSAFEALPQDELDALLANPDALRQVLLYHIVPVRLSDATVCRIATESGGSYAVQTLTGEDMILSCSDMNVIQVNGTTTTPPELRVNSNRALIHEIGGVLFPPVGGKPPVAVPDSFGPLTAGSQGLLQVLGNDSDEDGNLDPSSVMIIGQPSHGTAVPQPDGTVLYTHNGVPGTGSDSFTYTVKDTDGLESNVVTVTISPIQDVVPNMPPQAANDAFGPIDQGASTGPVDVLGNDSDPDGTLVPGTLTIVRQPANGTASVVNGAIVYVHNGRGSTTDSLVYVVADDDGASSNEATVTYTINAPANVPPVAADDAFGPVDQGSSTPLDVAANDSDSDGDVVPGSIVILGQPQNGTATVENGQIVYVNDGSGAPSDTLTYTIQDDDGAPSNEATVVITLNAPANQPPVAADDSFGPVDQGSTTPLNVAGNDSDPDGSVVPGTIVIVSQPSNGTVTVEDGQIVYVNDGSGAPSDTLTYTIQDDDGATSNVATVVITLNEPANQPPVAADDSFGPVDQGSTTPLNVAGNDSDPDGSVVPGTIVIVSQPSNGTVTVEDGQIVYVNDGSGAPSDTLTYTIQDDDGATSNVATVVITLNEPANQPPVAADDSFGPVDQGSTTPLNVAGNDSDPDGEVVPGTIVIVSQPSNGTATVEDGQIVYVNDGSGAPSDTLTYTIEDDDGATSNVATVVITLNEPANQPPVAADDSFGPVDQGSTTPLNVAGNDSDPDGSVVPGTIVIVSQPSNGTVTVEDGQIVYVNDGSGAPSDTLTYTIQDDDGATSNVATVVITLNEPANQPPVAADDSFGPVDQGSTTPLNVAGNDSDPDGEVVPGTIVIVSQPSNGTATVEDGQIVYVNDGSGAPSDTLTYTIQDDDGATSNVATAVITLNVLENVPPVAADDSFGPVEQGSFTNLPVLGNDSDADGTLVPGSIVITSDPEFGVAAVLSTGEIIYVNDGSGADTDSFTYTVNDDDGAVSNEATVTITLNTPDNVPPLAADDAFGPLEQGASGSLDVAGNDTDEDGEVVPGTIVIVTQPANGTASVVNGLIVYENDGSGALTDTLVYTIQDDDGATSNPATVTVTLNAPDNVPPVAEDDAFGPVEQASTTPLNVLGNDSDPDGTVLPGTIVITSQPANGTATVENGQIVYVNDGSGALSDTLTYTVQDDDGATSNVATVMISLGAPLNMPPVAVDETVGPLNTGGSTVIDVVANDFDDDGQVVPGTVTITSQPANGTAVVQGDGTVLYTNDGQPGSGSDSFTYTVQDDDGAVSNVATVTISPIEDSTLPNIVDLLIEKGNYTTLVELLEITGLADTLRNLEDEFTVFAPADDVFALLGDDVIDELRINVDSTRELLLYHVLGGTTQDLASLCAGGGRDIVTAQGETVTINCTASEAFVNASEIVSPDNFASNGVVHGIAPVLSLPDVGVEKNLFEVIRDDGEFTTLTELLIATGLDVVLADLGAEYTVFAPTDTAFAALDQAILDELAAHPDQLLAVLQYHVIAGQTLEAATLLGRNGETEVTVNGETVSFSVSDALFVNESKVVRTDIFATNGVAHAIDAVLIPDGLDLGGGDTLWDIVVNDSRFTKLKKLLELTGLDAEFRNTSAAYTGFLPTDEAFHRLRSDGNKSWLFKKLFEDQDVEYATKLLQMHVAVGAFDSASLLASGSVTNLNGKAMDFKQTRNCRTVDTHGWKWFWFKWTWVKTGSKQECGDTFTYVYKTYNQVIQADIRAKNGIAHVINYPLIPHF